VTGGLAEMEAALLVLRTARQAQHELHRVRWAAETTSGGVLVLASHPVSSGWPKLSHEPGTVLPLGETQLRWSTKACARSLTVVVAAQRPPGTRAGAVALEPGTAWWAPLRQKDDLVVVLSRYGAGALAAQAALEACVERWARATLGEASVPGALSAARRLAAVYAAPSRPARPFTWAVAEQVGRQVQGTRVPFSRLLAPLAVRRGWPQLPDAKALAGLLTSSVSLGRLAGFLARYDAKARLWRRPPVDLGRASAWLAEQRAKAHCVLTWADAGLLMDRWCGQEGRPVPALSRAEAEALVGAAHDEGFGLVLAVLGGGPASGAQVPSTSQWPARRTTLR